MGVSVYVEYLLALQEKASIALAISALDTERVTFLGTFKAKHLNVWPISE